MATQLKINPRHANTKHRTGAYQLAQHSNRGGCGAMWHIPRFYTGDPYFTEGEQAVLGKDRKRALALEMRSRSREP
jgi:hypothetical protein